MKLSSSMLKKLLYFFYKFFFLVFQEETCKTRESNISHISLKKKLSPHFGMTADEAIK